MNNGEGEKDTSNTSQKIVGEELMVEAELIGEKSKGNKRRRHSEKDGDKEDKEDLPGSKKVKKSPKKKQSKKRGRPSGKNKEQRKMYFLSGGVPSGNSGKMWAKRNPIYYRSQSAGVAMLVSRTTW